MKNSYASDFEKTLAKMQWPGKDVKIVGDLQKEWTSGVERLLELQEPFVQPVSLHAFLLHSYLNRQHFV